MKTCLGDDIVVVEDRGDEVLVELLGTGVRWVVHKDDIVKAKEKPDDA